MQVIGLTGSIATGKSSVSNMLRQLRIPVFDADACVHQLFASHKQVQQAIAHHFPKAVIDGNIHRPTLGAIVFEDEANMATLEAILHPKVRAAEYDFMAQACRRHCQTIVLDIPLLFETSADTLCDEIWVTYCPEFIQRQRIMRRPHMTEEKCDAILARQMPQSQKLARADVGLSTGIGKAHTFKHVINALQR